MYHSALEHNDGTFNFLSRKIPHDSLKKNILKNYSVLKYFLLHFLPSFDLIRPNSLSYSLYQYQAVLII